MTMQLVGNSGYEWAGDAEGKGVHQTSYASSATEILQGSSNLGDGSVISRSTWA